MTNTERFLKNNKSSLTSDKPSRILTVDVLAFSNMTQMNEMKANYKKLEDIVIDIRRTELDEFLKFDSNGRYGFFRCEACSGPILGHLEAKCRGLKGERYDALMNKSFEDWLERIPEFRQAIAERKRREEEK